VRVENMERNCKRCVLLDDPDRIGEAYRLASAKGYSLMHIGTYTGDTAATKAITGVGFSPKIVIIYGQVAARAVGIKSNLDSTKTFVLVSNAATLYADDQIISLDADGFTVGDGTGTANHMNLAQAYVYVAFG
jgi:hypothetical protein